MHGYYYDRSTVMLGSLHGGNGKGDGSTSNQGENCTSEPHHVVDYYSKPWSFLSRGAV